MVWSTNQINQPLNTLRTLQILTQSETYQSKYEIRTS